MRKAVIWLARTLKSRAQAHRRGLQRARPVGSARAVGPGLRHQHRGLQRAAGNHHRLARRQARCRTTHLPPRARRRRLSQARAHLLSPHPDDDVISMGGTLIRLCDQGHEVHVAYQTWATSPSSTTPPFATPISSAEYDRLFQPATTQPAEQFDQRVTEFPARKAAGPGRLPRAAEDQGPDPPHRGAGGPALRRRRPRDQRPLPGPAVLRDRPGAQEAARRRGHPDHHGPARTAFSPTRSTPPATCPTRTARTACAWRPSSRRPPPQGRGHALARRLRGLALPRRLAGVGRRRDRDGRAALAATSSRASASPSSSTRARRTGPCSPAPTSASSGSAPRTATAPPPSSTTSWAWPIRGIEGFVRWEF